MKKSLIILSALIALPLGIAVAGPECKTKCAKAKSENATTVATKECAKKCAKATAVAVAAKECDKTKCDKAAIVVADCNFNCEKSVAKVFTAFDKNKDGKLCKGEFSAFVKAMSAKKAADKATAAN